MRRGQDWRGILEWKNYDIPLHTSNDSAKLYDAAVTQYIGWYDDQLLGGLENTLNRMTETDPQFVSGRALKLGLSLIGTSEAIRLDTELKQELKQLDKDSKQITIPYREKKHVEALMKWSNGHLYGAVLTWEDILIEHPTDIHAPKMASDTYFYLGRQFEMRDSVAQVMPFWNSRTIPLKSYLHGMYAFGLVETNFHEKAEMEARKGLEENRKDGWATHVIAHVCEMGSRPDDAIKFMENTRRDWESCNHLACHNHWHWALYHIEKGEMEAATEVLEKEVLPRAFKSKAMLDIVDACSLPFRMELDDFDGARKVTSKHWSDLYSAINSHFNDHVLAFNDAHFLFACLGARNFAAADELIESLDACIETIAGKFVVKVLFKSIRAFGREQFKECVDLLYPIRYELVEIGGSDAQRDVFSQMLIVAALKSPYKPHRKLAEHLINERQANVNNSGLTNRFMFKLR